MPTMMVEGRSELELYCWKESVTSTTLQISSFRNVFQKVSKLVARSKLTCRKLYNGSLTNDVPPRADSALQDHSFCHSIHTTSTSRNQQRSFNTMTN